jgi:hypothetical protein
MPVVSKINRLLSFIDKLYILIDRPYFRPTKSEIQLIYELRDNISYIQKKHIDDQNKLAVVDRRWLANLSNFRNFALSKDPREFLHWKIIRNSMFVSNIVYIYNELKYIRYHPEWHRLYHEIRETRIGLPIPYYLFPSSSGNLIHHAYHICQFEEKTKVRAKSFDVIFEFGGGYGCMCRLLLRQGFKGKYIIFDLLEFCALQKYYLKSNDIEIREIESFEFSEEGVFLISDFRDIPEGIVSGNSMFIANWSFSEVPIQLRNEFLPLLSLFKGYHIAYQDYFNGLDNHSYFRDWMTDHKNVLWHNWEIEHLPSNYYLVGLLT